MTQRRYGPSRGAGTVIIEKQSEAAIQPAALGVTAYTGIMKKGPVGKAFRAKNRTQFLFKAGGIIPESLLPDAALNFYRLSTGAGEIWFNRLTDGSEKKSSLELKDREDERVKTVKFEAGNPGRWGGKRKLVIDEYASITANTIRLSNPPSNFEIDEFKGAIVKLKAVPGKSFEVQSNDGVDELTFAIDVNLIDEINGSANTLLSLELTNGGEALGFLIKDGLANPTTEWGLEVYILEGGILTLTKQFSDLSSDPTKSNYFVDVINGDGDSDFLIKAEDLNTGSLNADKRPANVSGLSTSLTDTVLTAKIHDLTISAVQLAKAQLRSLSLGAEVIEDELTLTNTAAGARSSGLLTFPGNPADNDDVTINGFVITFKTVVGDANTEVLIGASAEDTLDNLVSFINSASEANQPLLFDDAFAEKASASTMDLFAQNAGVASDALTTVSSGGGTEPTWGSATLSGGVDQTWAYVSKAMPFVTGLVVTTGVAFVSPNDFGFGFTLQDTSKSSSKEFQLADTVKISLCPFKTNELEGGSLIPNVTQPRKRFSIVSNSANAITVRNGSLMLANAAQGDNFRIEYVQTLAGGYDGIASVDDTDYEDAYEPSTSPMLNLRGKNLGLVKFATPGITSTAVQKAGVNFAASQNWQYRYEIPANVTDEVDAEEYINDTLGRSDFAVVHFPSYIKVSKEGGGLKLITATGGIQGREAKVAKDFDGFHKAAAGIDVTLSNALALPDGVKDKVLDEEFLNPNGINILKFKDGNVILWGDRSLALDPAFKFKHQREYLSHVENVFLENFDFIIFALNTRETQEQLKAAFIQYFTPELAKNAIIGDSVQDAINLKIDDENNTDASRAAGDLNAEMSLKIVDTVERFIINISKLGVTESLAQ